MCASQNPNRATKDDAHRIIGTRRSPGITGAFRYRRAVAIAAPVNRRTRKGTKQRKGAIQRPLLLFTKTRI